MHKGKYEIIAAQKQEIEEVRRKNKDKRIEAKLKVLSMRADGMKSKEISKAKGFRSAYVSTIVSKYIHGGVEAITGNHYPGNRCNMSYEEEKALLEHYLKQAEKGQMLDTAELMRIYEKAVGHRIGSSQI